MSRPTAAISSSVFSSRSAAERGAEHAVVRMVVEEPERDLVERRLSGADLGEDVDAVAVVAHHALDPADLTLDAAQPRQQLVLGRCVAAGGMAMLVARLYHYPLGVSCTLTMG